jgi:hypothetical protein
MTPDISLKWKEDPMEISQEENAVDGKSDSVLDQKEIESRLSGRLRKHLVTRNNFLWTVG